MQKKRFLFISGGQHDPHQAQRRVPEEYSVKVDNSSLAINSAKFIPTSLGTGKNGDICKSRPASVLSRDLTTALHRAGAEGEETALLLLRINDYRELKETLGKALPDCEIVT